MEQSPLFPSRILRQLLNNNKNKCGVSAEREENDYGLILMDIRMPIMDGYEATRRIRSLDNKEIANIPIIALTAQDTEDDRKATAEAGMNYYLTKPIDIDHFNEIVKISNQ